MVATKEGFGVKYSGDMLASRAGVKVDAKGNVIYNNIAAEAGNIEVKTTNGDIKVTGITHSKNINNDINLRLLDLSRGTFLMLMILTKESTKLTAYLQITPK